MVQQVKLLPVMLAHNRVCVPDAPCSTWLPASGLGKAVEVEPNIWAPASICRSKQKLGSQSADRRYFPL